MTHYETVSSLQDKELSAIQELYNGANIFVTGATGFVGRLLIEKLLRTCPKLSTLYLLIRQKKGKDMHTRMDELFDDVMFNRLKEEQPKFRHQVVAIEGNCDSPNLGLSLENKQTLVDKVNVIFHVAATVRFDEKLKNAVNTNVRSLQDIIALSKQMPNLKVLMHVSTLYANCHNDVIDEKFYESPIDSKKLMMFTEAVPDPVLEKITPHLLDRHPNTYAYTKCVAEDVVRLDGHNLPIGVFRPAIVISTYKEPIPGWINNLYGPTGVCAGAGTGVLRALHCSDQVNANVVPGDMCVNALIASSWEVYENFQKHKADYEIPIYNFESSNENPINYRIFMDRSSFYGLRYPSIKGIWCYNLSLIKNYYLYMIAIMFLHYLPALIVDVALVLIWKKPKMLKIYKKIHKFTNVIAYFCTTNWTFKSKNMRKLCDKMSQKDKELFFCDIKQLDWEQFFSTYLYGIRLYLIQDPLDTVEEAKVKYNRFYWCHQIIKIVVCYLLLRLSWSILSSTFNMIY